MYSTTSTALRSQKELVTISSRVPGPTVNRRVSVNSGAERMGATKKNVSTSVSSPKTEETMCLENCDTSCLGEWSSSDVGPGAAKPI